MHEIRRSPRAADDLVDIWIYSAGEWGPDKADEYLLEISAAIGQLKTNPLLGKACDEIRQGYRSLAINRHIVFYRIEGEIVAIMRVLHDRMMPSRHL